MSNQNNGLITKIWGPGLWVGMHSITFGYPITPTEENKKDYFNYFNSVGNILPCKYCRESYNKFIQEPDTRLEDFLDNRERITYWLYLIHEKVNNKLGVDYKITFEDVKKRYETYRAQCSSIISKKAKGCIIPLDKKNNSYQVLCQKDCPVIDYKLAKKFYSYAIERGFNKDEIVRLKNCEIHRKKKDKFWIMRNKYCDKLIKKMRNEGLPSLETDGKYKGKLTINELKLILLLCSNLSKDQLEEL